MQVKTDTDFLVDTSSSGSRYQHMRRNTVFIIRVAYEDSVFRRNVGIYMR
jgi:hypothetical protein